MSDKEQTTAKEIISTPKTVKGSNPLEIIRRAQETINGQLLLVGGEIQRKLKELVEDVKSLAEFGHPIKWEDGAYSEFLKELNLQPISTDESKERKRMSPANSKSDWGSMKIGKLIMEKFSKSDELTADIVMKKFDLSKNTATQYLSKGSSDGYLESLGAGKYKRLR